jgi:uncharacterized protein
VGIARPWVVARGFYQRLLGIGILHNDTVLLIPECRVVHTFGLRRPISVVFVDRKLKVLRIVLRLKPWRIAACRNAWGVVESFGGLDVSVGQQLVTGEINASTPPRGSALIEAAIAIPMFLFLILLIVQLGILWHAKFAVSHAALISVRQASLHHGGDAAIRDGLVVGLLPLAGKTQDMKELPTGLFRSGAEITMGLSMGWIRWEVLSPTRQSFLDWGQPVDRLLNPTSVGDIEIPGQALPSIAQRLQPKSGVLTRLEGLPVGNASGQTLIDANNLKVYFQIGIPLRLPVVGKLIAKTLALFQGCGWSLNSPSDRLGLVDFGAGVAPGILSPTIECRALAARNLSGDWQPRWPVGASAVIQMQTSARQSLMVLRDRKHYPQKK